MGGQLQESHLPDRIRVWEALDLFARVPAARRLGRGPRGVGPGAESATPPSTSLSGGQRQRLLVALALVTDPDVVFLDEMTTGLDPAARHVSWGLIEAIRERGTTVILVTHFMDEAERLCDRVAVVGRQSGSPRPDAAELVAAHADGVTVTLHRGVERRGLPRGNRRCQRRHGRDAGTRGRRRYEQAARRCRRRWGRPSSPADQPDDMDIERALS